MAYDRFDRDERSRWSDGRRDDRRDWRSEGRDRDERGFFERASDEVASWFGDDEADRRRRQDSRHDEPMGRSDRDDDRDRDYNRSWTRERSSRPDRDFERNRTIERGYRPMTGDYGRGDHESEQFFAASGFGRGERGFGDYDRSQTPYGRDERTSFAGARERGEDRDFDPHYRSWRDRHMGELDRDYADFRREHQSKFESDFGSWREKRQQKRGLLGQVREHMEVVGKDDEHVGTIDKVAGDRIILTKSDTESGGAHHSLSCSDIDRVEGDRVILDCNADDARNRWRDESRSRALFEREDQGEMGPGILDRSFSGTYR